MDMKSSRLKRDRHKSDAATQPVKRNRVQLEWPLLIYPVLFLSTLVILYVVNQSIQKESPAPPTGQHAPQEGSVTSGRTGQPDRTATIPTDDRAPSASGPVAKWQEPARATGGKTNEPPAGQGAWGAHRRTPTSPAPDRPRQAADPAQLQGVNRTLAMLRTAVNEKDHARIKRCLDELVALGDAAVVPLNDLITNEQGDTALWAATALARIGTPVATSALLDRLSQTKEGPFKEELSKRVSGIGNHDSWPLLLDTMMQTGDATVVRAAAASLSRMADTPVIDEAIARYELATTAAEMERLTQLIRSVQSPKATEALLSLAGDVSSAPQDPLQQAAIEALAKIGDAQAVSHLLRRLESAPPGEETAIFNAITQISNPEAQVPLLYAAAGNKEVSAEHGRTAAIYALKNFPDDRTVALLEHIIAEEQNTKVLTAASRTLEDIKRAPHTVTANADPLAKNDYILPPPPEKK